VITGLSPHLRAPALAVAPVRNVADVDHQRHVHDGVSQGARPEAPRMLAHQVPRQEPAVRAARHRHAALVHQPYASSL